MTSFTLIKLKCDALNIFKKTKESIKAYQLLEKLRKTRPNAQPPTVYRALTGFASLHFNYPFAFLIAGVTFLEKATIIELMLLADSTNNTVLSVAANLLNKQSLLLALKTATAAEVQQRQ